MFNLLATNLHDGNVHDLTSSLGLIGNSILMSTQRVAVSTARVCRVQGQYSAAQYKTPQLIITNCLPSFIAAFETSAGMFV